MANVKFSDLTALTTPADDDLLVIVDDSESGAEKSKKITYEDLVKAILPPGMVAPFFRTAPTGWLECDGSAVSRTTYANLFAVISDDFGNGDGSTTFNLPDTRGLFLRSQDNSAGVDPDAASRTDRGDSTTGDAIGTKQAEGLISHGHTVSVPRGITVGAGAYATGALTFQAYSIAASVSNTGGNETRPTNINVLYCIKF